MTDLRKKLPCTVNVLGTPYRVEMREEDDDIDLKDCGAYCSARHRLIVLCDLVKVNGNVRDASKKLDIVACLDLESMNLRHELLHAFLNESGLQSDAFKVPVAWPKNEEMVGWFGIQSPKIFKLYKELGIL